MTLKMTLMKVATLLYGFLCAFVVGAEFFALFYEAGKYRGFAPDHRRYIIPQSPHALLLMS